MPRLRRFVAALTGALLLQLTLLGSGAACEMGSGSATATASAPHDMQGMTHDPAAPARCGGEDMTGGCGVPMTSGPCTSPSACAVAAVPSFAVVPPPAAPRAEAPDREPAALPTDPTSAPELPPPRA